MQSESNFTLGSQHLDTTWNVLSEFSTQFLTDFSVFFVCVVVSTHLHTCSWCSIACHWVIIFSGRRICHWSV